MLLYLSGLVTHRKWVTHDRSRPLRESTWSLATARLGAVCVEGYVHLLSRVYVSNLCGKSHGRPMRRAPSSCVIDIMSLNTNSLLLSMCMYFCLFVVILCCLKWKSVLLEMQLSTKRISSIKPKDQVIKPCYQLCS